MTIIKQQKKDFGEIEKNRKRTMFTLELCKFFLCMCICRLYLHIVVCVCMMIKVLYGRFEVVT